MLVVKSYKSNYVALHGKIYKNPVGEYDFDIVRHCRVDWGRH